MSAFDAIAVGQRVLNAEAEALALLSASLDESFVRAVEALFDAKGRVVCTGIGKSGHVARKIAATLASTGSPAMFVHAAEASHGDLGMIGQGDVVLALSKSGEARELSDSLAYAKRFSIPLIAITAVADSQLGRAADILLLLPDAPEATPRSTPRPPPPPCRWPWATPWPWPCWSGAASPPATSASSIRAASWAPCCARSAT
jgi:arabinose-5-phosphate isomerase